MTQKREDEIVVESLGFPVVMRDVPVKKFRGEWEPDIDWDDLQNAVMLALVRKPAPLTGDEIRFVRQFTGKTLAEFAEACGMSSHQAVMNWEKKGDDPTGMRKSTEIVVRARILEALPAEMWERFEESDAEPKASFSRRLRELSEFDRHHDQVPVSITVDPDRRLDVSFAA